MDSLNCCTTQVEPSIQADYHRSLWSTIILLGDLIEAQRRNVSLNKSTMIYFCGY
jgi:hypothetical protein